MFAFANKDLTNKTSLLVVNAAITKTAQTHADPNLGLRKDYSFHAGKHNPIITITSGFFQSMKFLQ